MVAIPITRSISIDDSELIESTTRSGGAGGQHVNTTDSAVILRFDLVASTLPDAVRNRLVELAGSRLTRDGVIVLRSEGSRSQHDNRAEVRERLFAMLREATIVPKKRRPTKPTKGSQTRRMDGKTKRSAVKAGRGKVRE
ncbi:alternative ribosome rescue aminoacyl-tRNA hydrolase ArfB [Sphingomonas sp. RS2018]